MNTCLALQLIAFSGCEYFGTEKGSCDIYAVLKPWSWWQFYSRDTCTSGALVTAFLSCLGQAVWSRIFKRLAQVYTVLMIEVEDAGMWLSVFLWFSLSLCKLVYLHVSPTPSLPCLVH